MQSRTIVLVVGLLAAPLSLIAGPDGFNAQPRPSLVAGSTADTVNGHVLTPAPMPEIMPGGVSPADRVAGAGSRTLDAGPINSTPFSDTPSGTLSDGGDQEGQRARSLSPSDSSEATPNLGR